VRSERLLVAGAGVTRRRGGQLDGSFDQETLDRLE
jgi:hypothetical protein